MKFHSERKLFLVIRKIASPVFLFLALVAIAFAAQAHNKVGNGGNSIVCEKDGEIQSAHLLDFYEGNMHVISAQKDADAIADERLVKLKSISPRLSQQYLQRLQEMKSEIEFKNDVRLTDTEDSKHLFQPLLKGCNTVQTAIRRNSVSGAEKRFVMRQDIWEHLTPTDQAGLKLHEIIYEHLSKLGEIDSVKARKINRFLFAKQDLNAKEFWKLMKDLEVPIYP